MLAQTGAFCYRNTRLKRSFENSPRFARGKTFNTLASLASKSERNTEGTQHEQHRATMPREHGSQLRASHKVRTL